MCQLCTDGWENATAYHHAQHCLANRCPVVLLADGEDGVLWTRMDPLEVCAPLTQIAMTHESQRVRAETHMCFAVAARRAHEAGVLEGDE